MQAVRQESEQPRGCRATCPSYPPWGVGGVTHDKNLITLCHTGHKGLKPHEDRELFGLIGAGIKDMMREARDEYWPGVRLYRWQVHEIWQKSKGKRIPAPNTRCSGRGRQRRAAELGSLGRLISSSAARGGRAMIRNLRFRWQVRLLRLGRPQAALKLARRTPVRSDP